MLSISKSQAQSHQTVTNPSSRNFWPAKQKLRTPPWNPKSWVWQNQLTWHREMLMPTSVRKTFHREYNWMARSGDISSQAWGKRQNSYTLINDPRPLWILPLPGITMCSAIQKCHSPILLSACFLCRPLYLMVEFIINHWSLAQPPTFLSSEVRNEVKTL